MTTNDLLLKLKELQAQQEATVVEYINSIELSPASLLEDKFDTELLAKDPYKWTPEQVFKEYWALSLSDKDKFHGSYMTLGDFGLSIDTKMATITLTASMVLSMRKNTPDLQTIDAVLKITGIDGTNPELQDFAYRLSAWVDEALYGVTEGNFFGLTSAPEVIKQIRTLISSRTPF